MEIFKKEVKEWERGASLKRGDWKMGKGLGGLNIELNVFKVNNKDTGVMSTCVVLLPLMLTLNSFCSAFVDDVEQRFDCRVKHKRIRSLHIHSYKFLSLTCLCL